MEICKCKCKFNANANAIFKWPHPWYNVDYSDDKSVKFHHEFSDIFSGLGKVNVTDPSVQNRASGGLGCETH